MRSFRHRSLLFEAVDHEAAPLVAVLLGMVGLGFVAIAAVGGGVARIDGTGPNLVAWLAGFCLAGAGIAASADALAWLLARPVGRDAARTAAALEDARIAVGRLQPWPSDTTTESDLAEATRRVERAVDGVVRRLTEADGALLTFGAIADPATRTGRLLLLRDEARHIAHAAELLGETSHLLRWIEACPWSAARADALAVLRSDLAEAERLVNGGGDR